MENCIKKINIFKNCFKLTVFLVLFLDLFYCYYKSWNIYEDIPGLIFFTLAIICTIPFYFFMLRITPFPRGGLFTMAPLFCLKMILVSYISFLGPIIILFVFIKYKKLLKNIDIESVEC